MSLVVIPPPPPPIAKTAGTKGSTAARPGPEAAAAATGTAAAGMRTGATAAACGAMAVTGAGTTAATGAGVAATGSRTGAASRSARTAGRGARTGAVALAGTTANLLVSAPAVRSPGDRSRSMETTSASDVLACVVVLGTATAPTPAAAASPTTPRDRSLVRLESFMASPATRTSPSSSTSELDVGEQQLNHHLSESLHRSTSNSPDCGSNPSPLFLCWKRRWRWRQAS